MAQGTYTEGQEVVVVRSGQYDCTYLFGRVLKVTPTGQVTVKLAGPDPIRFNANGREIGVEYSRLTLRSDVDAVRALVAKRDATYKAVMSINKVAAVKPVPSYANRDALLEMVRVLKNQILEAEELVRAIPE